MGTLMKVILKPAKYSVPVWERQRRYVICLNGKKRPLKGNLLPCLPKAVCEGGCREAEYELVEAKNSPVYSSFVARIDGKTIEGPTKVEGGKLYLFDPFEKAYVLFSKAGIKKAEVIDGGILLEFSTGPFSYLNVKASVFSLDWEESAEEPNSGFFFFRLGRPWGFARIELYSPFGELIDEKEVAGKWVGIEKKRKRIRIKGCLEAEKVRVKGVLLKPKEVTVSCRTGKSVKIRKGECVDKVIPCIKPYAEILDEATNTFLHIELV